MAKDNEPGQIEMFEQELEASVLGNMQTAEPAPASEQESTAEPESDEAPR